MSEGVEDAYTGADSQALKRTGTQTSRQGVYKDIIPHNKQTDEAALKNGIIRFKQKLSQQKENKRPLKTQI